MSELLSLKRRFGIIGNDPEYDRSLTIATQVAPTDLSVLISGESGVGKEVFSKVIHGLSARKHSNFIAVNCGAIPEGTIDSELFGHEKGAFTGASEKRVGYFEYADGGSIFLDEIGEMPLGTQSRLLRILESGEFIKVGSSKVLKTNVRIIAATNVDLKEAIRKGKFREDLYYRLNTVPIHVPPLRERQEDVYLLFRKFTNDFSEKHSSRPISLDEEAQQILKSYHWPGNVRELKNIAEKITVLASDRRVNSEELREFLPEFGNQPRHLPMLAIPDVQQGNMSEREIMYKLLFEMRKDINDLKQFLLQMAEQGSLSTAELAQSGIFKGMVADGDDHHLAVSPSDEVIVGPIPVLSATPGAAYTHEETAEVVEESLSIAEKEKELIQKALKKHKGKRKNAAIDLGISERTLYRKIKEYQLIE